MSSPLLTSGLLCKYLRGFGLDQYRQLSKTNKTLVHWHLIEDQFKVESREEILEIVPIYAESRVDAESISKILGFVPKDPEYQYCRDEICYLVGENGVQFVVSRACLLTSPVLKMVWERGQETGKNVIPLPQFSEKTLKRVISLLNGRFVSDKEISPEDVSFFFLDDAPGYWLRSLPTKEDIEKTVNLLKTRYGLRKHDFKDVPGISRRPIDWEAWVYKWLYFVLNRGDLPRLSSEEDRIADMLKGGLFANGKVPNCTIELLTFEETAGLHIFHACMGQPFGAYIIRSLQTCMSKLGNKSYPCFWWAFAKEGWRDRDRKYANLDLVPCQLGFSEEWLTSYEHKETYDLFCKRLAS